MSEANVACPPSKGAFLSPLSEASSTAALGQHAAGAGGVAQRREAGSRDPLAVARAPSTRMPYEAKVVRLARDDARRPVSAGAPATSSSRTASPTTIVSSIESATVTASPSADGGSGAVLL